MRSLILVLLFVLPTPLLAISEINAKKLHYLELVLQRQLPASSFSNFARKSLTDAEFLEAYADRILAIEEPWTAKREDVRNKVSFVIWDLRYEHYGHLILSMERDQPETDRLAEKLVRLYKKMPPRSEIKSSFALVIAYIGGWRIKDMPLLWSHVERDDDRKFADYIAEGIKNGNEPQMIADAIAYAKNKPTYSSTFYAALIGAGLVTNYKEALVRRIRHISWMDLEDEAFANPSYFDQQLKRLLVENDSSLVAAYEGLQTSLRNSKAKYMEDRDKKLEWLRIFRARAIPEFTESTNVVALKRKSDCNDALKD